MKTYRVIIPSWSELEIGMQAETGSKYPAFILLGGQPLYVHIIRHYERIREDAEFVVVLPLETPDLELSQLSGFDVRTVRLASSKSIGDTVFSAMHGLCRGQSVLVHMADTLLDPQVFEHHDNILWVQRRNDLYRWTSIRKDVDGVVRIVLDRDQRSDCVEQIVCVGVFKMSDGVLLANKLGLALNCPSTDIDPFFSAIEAYSDNLSIDLKMPESWFDCGHVDSYYESRLNFQNLRHFNMLSYDAGLGLVTKRSENAEAFRHQVRWFKQLPDDLAPFLPRIYGSNDGDAPYITMELLSIPTLNDLFISGRLELGAWNDVAQKLNLIQLMLRKYTFASEIGQQIAYQVYVSKTRTRLHQFCNQRPEACSLTVCVSGNRFSINEVLPTLEGYAEKNGLLELDVLAPIHGDMCFSNVMYDPRGRHIKLIDPRGEFGVPGIFGDSRYDKAKLMHSFAGGYDFIVSDHFDVTVSPNQVLNCSIDFQNYHHKVGQILDSALFKDERERQQCDAIQALLFLSMIPLHSDKPRRQLAMLHTGLTLYAQRLFEGKLA